MAEEPIQVVAYAGHRGNESPREFTLAGKKIAVRRILSQWIEEDASTRGRRRCFRVKGDDFQTRILICDEDKGEWFCQGESKDE
jgi:hypothetical protein